MTSSGYKQRKKAKTENHSIIYSQIGVCIILTLIFTVISQLTIQPMEVVHNNIRNVLNYNVDIKSTAIEIISYFSDTAETVPANSQNN